MKVLLERAVVMLAAAGVLVMASERAYGQPVSMPNRPFAVSPVTLETLADGFFQIADDDQIIGVYLLNDGTTAIRNVTAAAAFDPSSGIVLTKAVEEFGDLEPGISTLGFFRASFAASAPDKHLLTLDVTGDSFSQIVSRNLFVVLAGSDQGNLFTLTAFTLEGNIAVETFDFFGGVNLGSLLAPRSVKMTVDYNQPFEGQFGPFPYSDPWWKTAGLIGTAFFGGFTFGTVVADVCGLQLSKKQYAVAVGN